MFQRGTGVQDPISDDLAIDLDGMTEQRLTILDNRHLIQYHKNNIFHRQCTIYIWTCYCGGI